jgi:hypothetical protein
VTDIELVHMARRAAQAEGKRADSLDDLIRADVVASGFGHRPDGSGPLLLGDRVIDSLRGARGCFTPIPDVPLRHVTRSESDRFLKRAEFYGSDWREMDPLMVGVRRFALDQDRRERILIDANVSPFVEPKYGWVTSLLGPPTNVKIASAPGDIITAQAAVKGGLLWPQIPLHHVFIGVQDNEPLTDLRFDDFWKTLAIIQSTPGYLRAWPKLGFLDWLPLGLGGGPPDANGFSSLLLGIWRRQWGHFSVLALDYPLLAKVTPHLVPEEAETDAQVRVHVGDLSQAEFQTWVNSMTYSRSFQTTSGNVKLLHVLTQQLGVPREHALAVAEQLIDANLVCSLGGQYQLVNEGNNLPLWTSTKDPAQAQGLAPEDYEAPMIEWFRGLDLELTKYGDRIVVHGQLDMQRKETEEKPTLPFFNLRGLFGGNKKETPPPPKPEDAPDGPPAEEIQAPPKRKPGAVREF